MLALQLFHGRKDPAQDMNGEWGEPGPVFTNLQFAHQTYGGNINIEFTDGRIGELRFSDDMVYYDGMYYGDWSVFWLGTFKCKVEDFADRIQAFEQFLADLPNVVA